MATTEIISIVEKLKMLEDRISRNYLTITNLSNKRNSRDRRMVSEARWDIQENLRELSLCINSLNLLTNNL